MASEDQPHLVQALYSFKGRNNDELCFKKGDIITVTQTEEGGWWEGTFGEKTAWFPSNYVKEYKPNSDSLSLSKSQSTDWAAKQKAYRSFVLKDLIESEKAHVNELQGLYHNFLLPIEKAEIMKKSEYQQLVGNLTEVLEVHSSLLDSLREAATQPPSEQRVGRVFLTTAPQLKHILITYCASHPRAVCVLERYKQELSSLMEAHGAVSPGLLVLTAGLSKPFRRLDKYAGMLQEMERHVDESHPDRGDTQRSVAVYKDIASSCSVVRRQKEMEVEVLSGGVRGWEGAEELSALGDILHMGSVAVAPDHQDRYLVLFPSTLLVLSVSHRMSAFIYEGKLPLTGINVNKLEETENCKNSFEIVGPMIERIVAVCQTKEDQQTWIDLLRQQIRAVRGGGLATSPTLRQPLVPTSPSANSVSAANTQSRSHNKNNSTQRTLVSSLDNKFGSVVEKNLNHQDILRQTRLDNYSSPRLASPYARLAAYFARLVRRGVLTRKIVRRLLYRQFAVEGLVDTSAVRRRRSHRTECVIYPQKAVRTWLQEESDDEEEEEEMRGGSEVEDGEGSIESSGFKYVKGGVYRSTLTVMKVGVPDLSRMDSRTAISNQLTVENQGVVAFERQSMPSPTLRDRPLPPVHSVSLDLPPPPVRGAEIITPSSASSTSSVSTFPHRGMSHRSSDSGLADVTTPTSHHVVEECSSYETPCVCCGKGYTAPVVTVTDSESERDRCGFSDVIMERVNCPCNEESLVRDVCDDVIKHFSGENRSHFKCTCNDDSMKSICDDVINHFSSENCSVDGVNHIKCHCEGDPQHIIDDNCPLIDDAVRKKCICKGASNHEFDKNCRVNDVAKTKCYCKGVRNHDLEKNCAFNNVVIKQKCSEGDDTGKKCYYDDITTLYPPDNSITMYNLLDDVRYHSVEEEVATIECPRNFGDNYCPHGDLTTSVEYPCTVPEDVSNDADSSDVTDEQSVPLTYRSGMYAHWWLKKRVPIADVPTANVPSGQRMRQRSHTDCEQ